MVFPFLLTLTCPRLPSMRLAPVVVGLNRGTTKKCHHEEVSPPRSATTKKCHHQEVPPSWEDSGRRPAERPEVTPQEGALAKKCHHEDLGHFGEVWPAFRAETARGEISSLFTQGRRGKECHPHSQHVDSVRDGKRPFHIGTRGPGNSRYRHYREFGTPAGDVFLAQRPASQKTRRHATFSQVANQRREDKSSQKPRWHATRAKTTIARV